MSKWLVALDGSILSDTGFLFALNSMVKAVDILYLVHVIVVPNNLYLGYASPSFLDGLQQVTLALQNEGEDKGSRLLDQYEKKCQSQGVRCVKMKVSGSSPGDLLCAISKQEEITNLVVGRKSKGSVERFLLGSVSRYVLENADCNVIVIKHSSVTEDHLSRPKI
eukprot:TRINITY_DN2881_c0_g2_i3.p1 TRINITY_DN2881_c0_g2~~TRINITY_DN2881_c0_g2_i3.p1  ORF type:complete len:165 (+),score=35.68 TRINITY_DN2881_c0_g2_i3:161-655(+)